MRTFTRRTLGVLAGLMASGTAWAIFWDWDDEFQSRHWRTASLHWARDIHPAHPSLSWIQSHFDPPAHEMWCHHQENETANDCVIFHDLLKEWLIHYMDTPNPPAAAFSSFPQECQTICTP